jgi:hypothetical protein
MKRHLLLTVALFGISSCAIDADEPFDESSPGDEPAEVPGDEPAEVAYAGCWRNTTWSATTTNASATTDGAWRYSTVTTSFGSRTTKVRERSGHPYSVESYSTASGDTSKTYGYVHLRCNRDATGLAYSVYKTMNFEGTASTGCSTFPDQVIYAQVRNSYWVASC